MWPDECYNANAYAHFHGACNNYITYLHNRTRTATLRSETSYLKAGGGDTIWNGFDRSVGIDLEP